MKIDWFTFTAQIVNFLVLVALLRWLLYARIVNAMKKREERIAGRLEEADRVRTEAEDKAAQYEEKIREIDKQREESLKEARREAQEERQRLLKEARKESDRKREEWQQEHRREREDLLSDLRRQAGRLGVEAARRTLLKLADTKLEEQMCDTFAVRVRELSDQQREEIAGHLGNGARISIRSAFDLPDERRERLREVIREAFGHDGETTFEKSADLLCGLELDIGGYTFGWNVKEFLRDLELKFFERLRTKG